MWFDKNAEEAINYYVSVFSDSPYAQKGASKIITIQKYPEGITEGPMAGFDGKVLTGVFELDGVRFMALDGGPVFQPSGAISYLIECKDQEEIDYYWSKLSAVPQAEQCGWCKDKFGFTWQICPDMTRWMNDKDKVKSGKAMQAMLQMKKIDIAKLEEAYNS